MFRLVLSATLLLAGCGINCTEIGCSGSLTVHLDRALAEGAVVTVDLGDGALECLAEGDTGCLITEEGGAPALVIRTYMVDPAEEITLEVDEGAGAVAYTVSPEWGDPWYPNGEACGGSCTSGEADVTL